MLKRLPLLLAITFGLLGTHQNTHAAKRKKQAVGKRVLNSKQKPFATRINERHGRNIGGIKQLRFKADGKTVELTPKQIETYRFLDNGSLRLTIANPGRNQNSYTLSADLELTLFGTKRRQLDTTPSSLNPKKKQKN